ncbi:hypothetical protein OSH10_06455 [Kaistia defluvii]|uniref:hypothetical protein n=1 Tax=Kaistia defluvii TaxID=410841 RepID=UPI00225227E6|nr:hypothetical protein [Kaistia defluvii]MCX5518071.1 hypothetical protein [Kaistia defluvii]
MAGDKKASNEGRFAPLLSKRQPPQHVWDTVLFESQRCLVTPTKGSIVANWVLIIPQNSALSFAEVQYQQKINAFSEVRSVARELGAVANYLWFEHGPGMPSSEVGCGVDYAHIHLLLAPEFSLDRFSSVAITASGTVWKESSPLSVYNEIQADEDYYVFGDANRAYHINGRSLGRQFFRKVIAEIAERTAEWDYNSFQNVENAQYTVDNYSRVANAA